METYCHFPPISYCFKLRWCLDSVGGPKLLWHSRKEEPVILSLLLKVSNWHPDSSAQVVAPSPLNFLCLLRL